MKKILFLIVVAFSQPHLANAQSFESDSEKIMLVVQTTAWTHSYDLSGTGSGGYEIVNYFLLENQKAALCAYDESDLLDHDTVLVDPDCWADWLQDGEKIKLIYTDGETEIIEPSQIIDDRRSRIANK
ncbi:hypothetical protein ACJ3XI_08020 [Litorimonas sp. RW-G-Af-16]|uniref:hypothetical protein n=1 Tax=Litorimonas sp. RW-G-Af-16 TaxID=3241168 RepID=UPI00390CBAB6